MTSTMSDNHQEASSPRTELLSPTSSLRSSPQTPNHSHHSHSPSHRRSHTPTPIVSPRPTRQNSATERSKRERERELTHTNHSHRELITLLVDQEHETAKLRHTLYTTLQRLEQETQRISSLERENQETIERFRRLNESRVTALAETNEARQELRLVKFQLDNAQQDIARLQEALQAAEGQRDEADAAAARARSKARKLRHQRLIDTAREEGRRYGFDAGFRRAQAESTARQRVGAVAPTGPQRRAYLNRPSQRQPPNYPESEGEGEERESSSEDLNSIPIINSTSGPPAQGRPGVSTGNINNQSGAENIPERNIPSPSVDRYPVSIPPADVIERTYNNNPPEREWVTGQQHRDIHGHTPPYPTTLIVNGTPGRAQAPGAATTASTTPARPNKKGVKFTPSTFRRPSLAKTKQTATSWYRKLSFRKQPKKKIIIDPTTEEFEEEEEEETQTAAPAEPTGGSVGPQPGPSAPSVRSQTSTALRAQAATPGLSAHRTPGHSKAASLSSGVRARDQAHLRGHKRRSASLDTSSTRTSQFDLLNAPTVGQSRSGPAGSLSGSVVGSFIATGGGGPGSISGRSVKSAGAINKKLSIIKENPTSRDTTPVRPRFFESQGGEGSVRGQFEGDGRSVRSRSSRMFAMNPDPESPEWRTNGAGAQPVSGRLSSSSALMRPAMASNSSLSGLAPVAPLRTKKSGSLIDTPTPMPKNGRPRVPAQLGRQDTTGSSGNGIRIDIYSPSQSSGMPHSTPRQGPSQISPIRHGIPKIFHAQGSFNEGSEGGDHGEVMQHKRSGSTIGAGYTRNNAGMTPGPALFGTLSGEGGNSVSGGLGSELQQARLQRAGSSSSLRSQGSYSKFDPKTYVDPAMWGAPPETFANGGGSGNGHVRPTSRASSGLSYA